MGADVWRRSSSELVFGRWVSMKGVVFELGCMTVVLVSCEVGDEWLKDCFRWKQKSRWRCGDW